MGASVRMRLSFEGPDKEGLFTARAVGPFGELVETGDTLEEAKAKVLAQARPHVPHGVVENFENSSMPMLANPPREQGVGRYWRNLMRGYPAIGGMMVLYGRADKSRLDVVGTVSLALWGTAVLLNLGGAANAFTTGDTRLMRFLNGQPQRQTGRTIALGLAGIVIGAVGTLLLIR